jgi:hypothetical protein
MEKILAETSDDLLTELIENPPDNPDADQAWRQPAYDAAGNSMPPENPHVIQSKKADSDQVENISQWTAAGNGAFFPTGASRPKLAAGVYNVYTTFDGKSGLMSVPVSSDGIYNLPDMATQEVLKEVEKFWNSEHLYRKHNLLYKRGLLLFGPPGSGKTITVKMLMKEIIKRDGIVIICQAVRPLIGVLKNFRKIEPTRNVIVVYEDIDEIIAYNGEASVLSLLDGEDNIDNVLNIATTNFPDRLGARICNRPSRFDRRIFVGMPEEAARREYIKLSTHNGLKDEDLTKWTSDTKDMSLAHIRELVASVYCLDQPYTDVIKRLKAMFEPPVLKSDGFATPRKSGFAAQRLD